MDFLEGLKTNTFQYSNPYNRKSFADVAKEQKKKEDEDLFNNLMEGDGKMGSNRMALAEEEESRSKTNSALGYNSLHEVPKSP
jgi:hypothetical protein